MQRGHVGAEQSQTLGIEESRRKRQKTLPQLPLIYVHR